MDKAKPALPLTENEGGPWSYFMSVLGNWVAWTGLAASAEPTLANRRRSVAYRSNSAEALPQPAAGGRPSLAASYEERAQAAQKIQAVYRGFQERQWFHYKYPDWPHSSRLSEQYLADYMHRDAAALCIQTVYRAYRGRKQFRERFPLYPHERWQLEPAVAYVPAGAEGGFVYQEEEHFDYS
eukprot:TRINITY_DN30181_c0_g1_i1.p1 TRINITY_DN30181_c0_g1~~TRINITY_DN30181_c0_g1_i1.p1  ORF type:complete len:182 (-),score=32.37 TRINITY_DN30181_c0_g1_i1:46-591(-)